MKFNINIESNEILIFSCCRTEARLSMLSMSSQPTTQSTPHYVAELTESQAFVADIPPLVNAHYITPLITHLLNNNFMIGTCCIQ
jgi:hypothetical protein